MKNLARENMMLDRNISGILVYLGEEMGLPPKQIENFRKNRDKVTLQLENDKDTPLHWRLDRKE